MRHQSRRKDLNEVSSISRFKNRSDYKSDNLSIYSREMVKSIHSYRKGLDCDPCPCSTKEVNTDVDMMNEQFCRWWGYKWLRKREQMIKAQLEAQLRREMKNDLLIQEKQLEKEREMLRDKYDKSRRDSAESWRSSIVDAVTTKLKGKKKLDKLRKKELQECFATPCSSITFNNCYCTDPKMLNERCTSAVALSQDTRKKICKNNAKTLDNWVKSKKKCSCESIEPVASSSSSSCCHCSSKSHPAKSEDNNIQYLSLRMQCIQSSDECGYSVCCGCESDDPDPKPIIEEDPVIIEEVPKVESHRKSIDKDTQHNNPCVDQEIQTPRVIMTNEDTQTEKTIGETGNTQTEIPDMKDVCCTCQVQVEKQTSTPHGKPIEKEVGEQNLCCKCNKKIKSKTQSLESEPIIVELRPNKRNKPCCSCDEKKKSSGRQCSKAGCPTRKQKVQKHKSDSDVSLPAGTRIKVVNCKCPVLSKQTFSNNIAGGATQKPDDKDRFGTTYGASYGNELPEKDDKPKSSIRDSKISSGKGSESDGNGKTTKESHGSNSVEGDSPKRTSARDSNTIEEKKEENESPPVKSDDPDENETKPDEFTTVQYVKVFQPNIKTFEHMTPVDKYKTAIMHKRNFENLVTPMNVSFTPLTTNKDFEKPIGIDEQLDLLKLAAQSALKGSIEEHKYLLNSVLDAVSTGRGPYFDQTDILEYLKSPNSRLTNRKRTCIESFLAGQNSQKNTELREKTNEYLEKTNEYGKITNDYGKITNDVEKINGCEEKINGYEEKINGYKEKINSFPEKTNSFPEKTNEYQVKTNEFPLKTNDWSQKQSFCKKVLDNVNSSYEAKKLALRKNLLNNQSLLQDTETTFGKSDLMRTDVISKALRKKQLEQILTNRPFSSQKYQSFLCKSFLEGLCEDEASGKTKTVTKYDQFKSQTENNLLIKRHDTSNLLQNKPRNNLLDQNTCNTQKWSKTPKSDWSKPESARSDWSKDGSSKNDYSKNEYSKSEYSKNEYSKNEYSKNEYSKNEFTKTKWLNSDRPKNNKTWAKSKTEVGLSEYSKISKSPRNQNADANKTNDINQKQLIDSNLDLLLKLRNATENNQYRLEKCAELQNKLQNNTFSEQSTLLMTHNYSQINPNLLKTEPNIELFKAQTPPIKLTSQNEEKKNFDCGSTPRNITDGTGLKTNDERRNDKNDNNLLTNDSLGILKTIPSTISKDLLSRNLNNPFLSYSDLKQQFHGQELANYEIKNGELERENCEIEKHALENSELGKHDVGKNQKPNHETLTKIPRISKDQYYKQMKQSKEKRKQLKTHNPITRAISPELLTLMQNDSLIKFSKDSIFSPTQSPLSIQRTIRNKLRKPQQAKKEHETLENLPLRSPRNYKGPKPQPGITRTGLFCVTKNESPKKLKTKDKNQNNTIEEENTFEEENTIVKENIREDDNKIKDKIEEQKQIKERGTIEEEDNNPSQNFNEKTLLSDFLISRQSLPFKFSPKNPFISSLSLPQKNYDTDRKIKTEETQYNNLFPLAQTDVQTELFSFMTTETNTSDHGSKKTEMCSTSFLDKDRQKKTALSKGFLSKFCAGVNKKDSDEIEEKKIAPSFKSEKIIKGSKIGILKAKEKRRRK